jgi:hypothetical protein
MVATLIRRNEIRTRTNNNSAKETTKNATGTQRKPSFFSALLKAFSTATM